MRRDYGAGKNGRAHDLSEASSLNTRKLYNSSSCIVQFLLLVEFKMKQAEWVNAVRSKACVQCRAKP